ncbi:hypothetical protein psyc5s11_12960 [Clostridium gelidum]|uniref:Uncharacterized protein n=1 Tax=Clostridium gelidum TaxID=704125 RepID=A0ABN6IT81_9CLOT|nr:hypothetical protein psyc5s11_12960 [Clostridium gelidum]
MAGCTHFCMLLRQAQDKQKWNNLPLRNIDSSFSMPIPYYDPCGYKYISNF